MRLPCRPPLHGEVACHDYPHFEVGVEGIADGNGPPVFARRLTPTLVARAVVAETTTQESIAVSIFRAS